VYCKPSKEKKKEDRCVVVRVVWQSPGHLYVEQKYKEIEGEGGGGERSKDVNKKGKKEDGRGS